jgi:hypothetical protein
VSCPILPNRINHCFHGTGTNNIIFINVVAAVMTQLSLEVVLKGWGKKAKEAAHSEMKQLQFRNMFTPLRWKDLTESQRKTVLKSHMFLKKEKQDEKTNLWGASIRWPLDLVKFFCIDW